MGMIALVISGEVSDRQEEREEKEMSFFWR